jgi:DNA-binding beta-propeller fold protein YncE
MMHRQNSIFSFANQILAVPLTLRPKTIRSAGLWKAAIFRILTTVAVLLMGFPHPSLGLEMTDAVRLFTISHQFNAPSDVAVSRDNRIYVVDGVNQKIKVFDSGGAFLSDFGSQGSGPGEFQYPLGIDIDRRGRVFVADSGNHRVQVLTHDGRYINEIKMQGTSAHPADPTDVVVDDNLNRCYVVDNDNHRILVYNAASLKRIAVYGQAGAEKRQFRYPFKIALDRSGYLYIVDVINTRVQVLNSDGLFVAFIGDWGVDAGEFFRPKGIALDRNGRVYVSDSYIGVVQVFNSNGEFHSVVGDRATGAIRKFKTPTGLCIDHQNRLYVVEMLSNRVSVFGLR